MGEIQRTVDDLASKLTSRSLEIPPHISKQDGMKVMMRPTGRIVFSCILFGPVVGLLESAWEEMRSFHARETVSATLEAQNWEAS